MTKTISITNDVVLNTLNNANNASELVAIAILYYLGEVDAQYVSDYKTIEGIKKSLKREITR